MITFGNKVFGESEMRQRLPEATFREMQDCIAADRPLPLEVANQVAEAMMEWAMQRGVTHYTHWFQPMTGITAEKHDSFFSDESNGQALYRFSGKALIKGEPDASSFPSGGLRATFEARGYTAWDPTSYAFIKDNVLCIPTAFCSYNGQALDKKTPLLRSMQTLNKQCVRLLRLLGLNDVQRVFATVGAEQEYFLVDDALARTRPDLVYTGRTLLGARPPKGQDLDDHYFGAIKPRVAAFMAELDQELWQLGVKAKTEHNEAAPAQHELASIYATANVATDHNQLTMEMMKKVAARHGMMCLLHEKPFEGVNGSGKHNNWSLGTDTGLNLFEPGDCPENNLVFLLMVCAVVAAVDRHADLLRIAVATAANDHRLGANEAPPAVISLFLGDELCDILDAIKQNRPYARHADSNVEIGVKVLPRFARDTTDRNRTSPFAFTGNKFEFRMPGSSMSIADANTVLNTIVADQVGQIADALQGADDIAATADKLMRRLLLEHDRILFNGNNYGAEWAAEAERRNLPNSPTTPQALAHLTDEKNIALFGKHKVYSQQELVSRQEIMLANYNKTLHIEATTLTDMMRQDVLPAVLSALDELSRTACQQQQLGLTPDLTLHNELYNLYNEGYAKVQTLEECVAAATALGVAPQSQAIVDRVLPAMAAVRCIADRLELLMPSKYWPYPSIGDLLFSVN